MSLDLLNKWLGPLSSLGVLAGLVLVAMQMNQTTAAIKLQNALELNRGIAAGEIAFMGDSTHSAYATAMFRPDFVKAIDAGLAESDPLAVELQTQGILEQIRNLDRDGPAESQ